MIVYASTIEFNALSVDQLQFQKTFTAAEIQAVHPYFLLVFLQKRIRSVKLSTIIFFLVKQYLLVVTIGLNQQVVVKLMELKVQ